MYNARYVPPNGNRRLPPPPPAGRSQQSRPQPVQKRVQIIDHNRRTPSSDYISERESQNSFSPDSTQKRRTQVHRDQPTSGEKSDSNQGSAQRTNNGNVHDYLYGLSAPDPG